MLSSAEIVMLVAVALTGHLMALFWFLAELYELEVCKVKIYALPIEKEQIKRELKNSLHTPIHAALLLVLLLLGFFNNTSAMSFVAALGITYVWAEIWHYYSHRAFHLRSLHWIHKEHHRSRLCSPITAISFSFMEKLIFNIGILAPLALIDVFYSLNFFGIATWYIGYLMINSFGHANFEIRSEGFLSKLGRFSTGTTYHALHHSRYTRNYGLGSRFLDKLNHTEWEDYEKVYKRVVTNRHPLEGLQERLLEGMPRF